MTSVILPPTTPPLAAGAVKSVSPYIHDLIRLKASHSAPGELGQVERLIVMNEVNLEGNTLKAVVYSSPGLE